MGRPPHHPYRVTPWGIASATLISLMVVLVPATERLVPELARARYSLRALRDGAEWDSVSDADRRVALDALDTTERALELSKRLTGTWYPP